MKFVLGNSTHRTSSLYRPAATTTYIEDHEFELRPGMALYTTTHNVVFTYSIQHVGHLRIVCEVDTPYAFYCAMAEKVNDLSIRVPFPAQHMKGTPLLYGWRSVILPHEYGLPQYEDAYEYHYGAEAAMKASMLIHACTPSGF